MKLKLIYAFLRFGCLPGGLILTWIGMASPPFQGEWGFVGLALKALATGLGLVIATVGLFVIHNVYFSRNRAWVDPELDIETWSITRDQQHNSNTDLTWFQGAFYLAHAVSPYHFGSADCKIQVKRSPDGLHWEQVAVLGKGNDDVRDPKFAVIGDRLCLYVLLNRALQPLPYTTRYAWTNDGNHWSDLCSLGHEGWLFWRPKTLDGRVWYVPAYWHEFNHNVLFKTWDGANFEMVATIHKGRFINEPEIEFLADGTLLATGRVDYDKRDFQQVIGIPQSSTIISVAEPPYVSWQDTAEDQTTRLDGPVMFRYGNHIFAVGRAHPYFNTIFPRRGAVLAKKRTAIYEVRPEGLTYLSDLPSAGDTSYAGVVVKDGFVYVSYYTSDIRRDSIWLFGMMEPSEIRMAKIALERLVQAAERRKKPTRKEK